MKINANGMDGVTVSIMSGHGPYVPLPVSATPGTVWFHNDSFHVYTGSNWQALITPSLQIGLDFPTYEAILWAKRKMAEEAIEAALLEKYPALKSAKENYNLIKNLVKDI